jgi:hypothetical protein
MLVTLLGIVMLVKLVQESNAEVPMVVTGHAPKIFVMASEPEYDELKSVIVALPLKMVYV